MAGHVVEDVVGDDVVAGTPVDPYASMPIAVAEYGVGNGDPPRVACLVNPCIV
jgi:hypothetical protein